MTIKDILTKAYLSLKSSDIPNPNLEAELLLSFVIEQPRVFILSHPKHILDADQTTKFDQTIQKRIDGTPLAYITHEKSFYGLDFYVDKNVLVPRPETEIMVDEALKVLTSCKEANIIDIGTGSGCIPISITHTLLKENKFTGKTVTAIDISKEALKIAKKNAETNNVSKHIDFNESNLLSKIPKSISSEVLVKRGELLITANLPYLTKHQIEHSPSIQKEPVLALDGGKDGMVYYIELFEQIKALKAENQINITLLAEIDHIQTKNFKKSVNDVLGDVKVDIIKDYSGYDRIVKISNF